MPWKESSVVEERLRFVARLLDGEAMTDLCREFGISRKTGGIHGLASRSRAFKRRQHLVAANRNLNLSVLVSIVRANNPIYPWRRLSRR